MLASSPASMVNQKHADLGIPNRFNLTPSRFSVETFAGGAEISSPGGVSKIPNTYSSSCKMARQERSSEPMPAEKVRYGLPVLAPKARPEARGPQFVGKLGAVSHPEARVNRRGALPLSMKFWNERGCQLGHVRI